MALGVGDRDFGVASLVAATLAPRGREGRAVAMVMIGLSIANVLGVPATTWMGQHLGWRSAFWVAASLAVLTALLVTLCVPACPGDPEVTGRRELRLFGEPQAWLTLLAGAIGFGGMFERLQFNMNQPSRPYGQWTFADIQSFLAGTPRQYRGTPPSVNGTVYNPVRGLRQWFGALYAEDTWQVIPRFTLSLGFRWEPYSTPTEVHNLIANIRNIRDAGPTTGGPLFRNK